MLCSVWIKPSCCMPQQPSGWPLATFLTTACVQQAFTKLLHWLSVNMLQVFAEFNTLSVIYQQPASQFVQATAYHSVAASEPPSPSASAAAASGAISGPESVLVDPSTNLLDATAEEADLLDLGADTGGGGSAVGPGAAGAGPGSSSVQQAGLAGLTGSLLDLDLGLGLGPAAAPSGGW